MWESIHRDTDRIKEMVRLFVLTWPDLASRLSPEQLETVFAFRIPWWAYLRAMWNLLWSCIRHPLSETTIDLSTGRVLYHT